MQKKLVILGTSGNALDVLDIVEAINAHELIWRVAGVLDDGHAEGDLFAGLPVLGGLAAASRLSDCWFVHAIGSDTSYRRRAELAAKTGLEANRFATLVHPQACVSSRAKLGHGVCVNFGASVAGNVIIEDHAIIGPRVIIGHDSFIGAWSLVAAGAIVSGAVRVGRACYIGAGSSVKQKVMVGNEALIGLGAVVVHDVDGGTTVVGNPARLLIKQGRKPLGVAV